MKQVTVVQKSSTTQITTHVCFASLWVFNVVYVTCNQPFSIGYFKEQHICINICSKIRKTALQNMKAVFVVITKKTNSSHLTAWTQPLHVQRK